MSAYLLLYFFVGVLQDLFWTYNVKYVANEKPVLASTFSFFTSVVSMGVFYDILTRLDSERSWLAILVYSLGIAVGTFAAMKLKFTKGKK
ncbi:hypothetical protein A2316_03710 [Candidatus Falkowbacteria bacterium RIFOXYB2_FULL_38_15]|uniref:DUF5698 domain-containing protein n=1 Tax=Candidatus Falkowbacteria bacterium RIFOXYA2_FULL_38_12 TaxID=1797993 RepID=A0A1F5S545_9BACT|nr:MAG: hypothetical protein A2257_00375 [Candidatus Falkowbacteria bacterium RIFOXYA2_FULL_38_12]OGF32200.1 MAG: hypothetical protein A2316_03710 [Candidatus Falkowbacteria bacterium RIFOXYB2_FULL_38_15]OGF44591.1 MAG: hypothetical protein A2555_00950 [Candidatus Falkowbacteria bacterium RIFOXYD2_FULL_39_16]